MDPGQDNWTALVISPPAVPRCHRLLLSFCRFLTLGPPFHLSHSALCAALSARRSLHLLGCVIEPCVPSLSAKRLADCLHFQAEGCEASVAAVRAIDWDPSKPPCRKAASAASRLGSHSKLVCWTEHVGSAAVFLSAALTRRIFKQFLVRCWKSYSPFLFLVFLQEISSSV